MILREAVTEARPASGKAKRQCTESLSLVVLLFSVRILLDGRCGLNADVPALLLVGWMQTNCVTHHGCFYFVLCLFRLCCFIVCLG